MQITKEMSLQDVIKNDLVFELINKLAVTEKAEGDLRLYKYNQYSSDFSYRCVRESRGSILRNGEYVCRPFDKFFNLGEPNAASIDWNTALITEKCDGSIIKCWYDTALQRFRFSTMSSIDASAASLPFPSNAYATYGNVLNAYVSDVPAFTSPLNPAFTYIYELVSPFSQVVIRYDDTALYGLAIRDNASGKYVPKKDADVIFGRQRIVALPKVYDIATVDDAVDVVRKLNGYDKVVHEGVVVADTSGNRIKIKTPEYLITAKLMVNGPITAKRYVEFVKAGTLDDVYAAGTETQKDDIAKWDGIVEGVGELMARTWEDVCEEADDAKLFAEKAKRYNGMIKAFLFQRRKEEISPKQFIMNMSASGMTKMLEGYDTSEKE